MELCHCCVAVARPCPIQKLLAKCSKIAFVRDQAIPLA